MGYQILLDESKCIACGACSVACMDQNDIDVAAGEAPYRTGVVTEADGLLRYSSIGCLHCADAPCMAACPVDCLYRDEETGFVLCDEVRCIGCRACAAACPVSHPRFSPVDGTMRKCDGCAQRVKSGLLPACVKICPFGALTLKEI